MKKTVFTLLTLLSVIATQAESLSINLLSSYTNGSFEGGGSEITAYDSASGRLFVTNGQSNKLDIFSIDSTGQLTIFNSIDLTPYGSGINSVAAKNGLIAAAIDATNPQANGKVVFFDAAGTFISAQEVGAMPDMVTFTPDGKYLLAACEGEPNSSYTSDPEGCVGIIEIMANSTFITHIASFGQYNPTNIEPGIRIFGPGASVAQDLEPEYIAVASDSKTAWVVCQENNALATINLETKAVTSLKSLGYKDHSISGRGLDPSDSDNGIKINNWPVRGLYMPDAIAWHNGHLFTANEGDSREYTAYVEDKKVKDINLDPVKFPDAVNLKKNENLGKLKVTTATGDTDGDGDYDELYSFGARSFSVFNETGTLVWDSGDQFEQLTAQLYPQNFNCDNNSNTRDSRSDNKGPEPEGLTIGTIDGRTYAFIGLERISVNLVYDITDPANPLFSTSFSSRIFSGSPASGTAGDLGPEGLLFIKATDNPTGKNLLITSNEISSTIAISELSSASSINNEKLPENTKLTAYPNPFNPSTTINFTIPRDGLAELTVFNTTGEKVSTLIKGGLKAGCHQTVFNANNLPSGIYYSRLKLDNQLATVNRMLLIK